ncbi:MAG: hypothetical protein LBE91_03150 [Tannerella sp.]|nr:hypothetical protein [Tannerella sp.]
MIINILYPYTNGIFIEYFSKLIAFTSINIDVYSVKLLTFASAKEKPLALILPPHREGKQQGREEKRENPFPNIPSSGEEGAGVRSNLKIKK